MRPSGTLRSSHGRAPRDHVCWGYDHHDELRREAVTFLADGVALGERVGYAGSRPAEALHADLAGMAGLDALVASGAAFVESIADRYGDELIVAREQVEVYASATAAALADGYTGLRVVADVSDIVDGAQRLDAFLRYEHAMDAAMAGGLRFTAMCAFDRSRLGAAAVDAAAHLHPFSNSRTAVFSIHAGETGLSIVGELDLMVVDQLAAALDRALTSRQGVVDVDVALLRFVDHRSLLALDEGAARRDVTLRLRGATPLVTRLVPMLGLERVEAVDR